MRVIAHADVNRQLQPRLTIRPAPRTSRGGDSKARDLDIRADLNREDDDGLNWALLRRAEEPSAVVPGAVLRAGMERAWSWVQIASVDPDGVVHFPQISGAAGALPAPRLADRAGYEPLRRPHRRGRRRSGRPVATRRDAVGLTVTPSAVRRARRDRARRNCGAPTPRSTRSRHTRRPGNRRSWASRARRATRAKQAARVSTTR